MIFVVGFLNVRIKIQLDLDTTRQAMLPIKTPTIVKQKTNFMIKYLKRSTTLQYYPIA